MHVNLTEKLGYYHYAHSYVRDPWRNKKVSAPIILAKKCHDMGFAAEESAQAGGKLVKIQ